MASFGIRPLVRCLLFARYPSSHSGYKQQPTWQLHQQQQTRTLYTEQSLGIDLYIKKRQKKKLQFGEKKDQLMEKMRQSIQPYSAEREGEGTPSSSGSGVVATVFAEDLKNMLDLTETDEEIDICVQMMRRFHEQSKALRFGTFVFGPVAMRLFYLLDKPDLAIQTLKDPQLAGFFYQFTSYQIAMDLLYKRGRYNDVKDLYEHMRKQQLHGTKFPRDCVVLVLGACYQIGTRESYDFALSLIREARKSGALILRKGLTFTAALALKMDEPKIAMELLALTAQMNYITVRNLRMIALSHLDRYEDIFLVLRSISHEYHHMRVGDSEICQDTIDRIQQNLEKKGDTERMHLFTQLQRSLKEGNHISSCTVDELLNRPMQQQSQDSNPPLAMFTNQRQAPPYSPSSSALRRPEPVRRGEEY